MKRHPETIPQKIQSSILSRSRRSVAPQRPQQPIPQDHEQQLRPLPPLPKSNPPSRLPPPTPSQSAG